MQDLLTDTVLLKTFEKSSNSLLIKADPPRFTMVAVSDLYEKISSIKRENLVGRGVFDVFTANETDPSGARSAYQAFLDVIQTKQTVDLPIYRYDIPEPATGKLKPHYWSNSNVPILDDNGEVVYILNTTTDITDQVLLKQEKDTTAQTLVYQQQRTKELFQQAPVAIATLIGPEHIVEVANEKILAIWGKTADQVINKPLCDGLPEAKEQGLEQRLASIYQTGDQFIVNEQPIDLPRDGRVERMYCNFVYEPFRELDGRLVGIIVLATDVTESVHSRQKVEQSEANALLSNQRLTLALEAGRLGSYVLDLATGQMQCTVQCKANYGLPPNATFNYEDLLAVIVPSDRSAMQKAVETAIGNHTTYHAEYRVNWPDGSLQWIKASGQTTYDVTGKPLSIIGITVNITEQKQADAKIRESEERLRAIVEQSPVAMTILRGNDLVIEIANQAILDIWDKPASIIGMTHEKALPEITSQAFMQLMHQVLDTGEPYYGFEAPAQLYRNGLPRMGYFNFAYVPLREPDTTISGILVATTEVTPLVLARLEREENEKRFRTLLETIPHITWTSTPDGKIDFFNQHWYEYTGLTFEQSKDWQWQSVVHPADVVSSVAAFSKALVIGETVTLENRYRQFDGQYRWHLNRALPIRNEQGEIRAWIGTATDIHEQKQMTAELDRQVQLRTQELQATNQDLRRSNENLQQFAYVASHDLQEPLRKVQSFGDLLKAHYATQLGEGVDLLERMQLAANRMSVLIKDLLAYSRISTRQESADAVALNQVVATVLEDLDITIQQTGATIQVDSLPTVLGDAMQLGQLFQNLLSNALKFRQPDTAPLIRISCQKIKAADLPSFIKPARQAEVFYQLYITDNGIGFDAKYVDRIFEVFQRLHSKNHYSGTGIGLAIVQKVAINHGGAVTATSEPGKGTTFVVYLPA